MAKAKITQKPKPAPKHLTLTRSSDHSWASIKAAWGIPADAYFDSNHGRWSDAIDEKWVFSASSGMSKTERQQRGDDHMMADRVWVRDKGRHSENTMWYDRKKYHPCKPGRYLRSVTADVYASNSKGKTHAKATFTFQKPRQPTIGVSKYAEDTGTVTFKVNTSDAHDANDAHERYDTMIRLVRTDSANRKNGYKSGKVVKAWFATTATSKEISYDLSDALRITPGQWVRIRCEAYARGVRGNSANTIKDYYYAYPAVPTITGVSASSKSSTGNVTVAFNTNATTTAPVDHIRLQRLRDVTLATADAAAASSAWEDVDGAEDDGNANGFADTVADATPGVRRHTWYRLVTEHGALTRYSAPVEATCLYKAKDATGTVSWLSLEAGEDGTSVRMAMEWATDSHTACEVAWADQEDAWESNDPPETYTVDWEDDVAQGTKAHSASFVIRGLDKGSEVYVRARRLTDADGVISHGSWCTPPAGMYPVTVGAEKVTVTLEAPEAVVRGEGIPLTWAVTGGEQTQWKAFRQDGPTRLQLASGEGAEGAATIPASSIEGLDTVTLVVEVTCGGDWAASEAVPVTIREAPTLAATMSGAIAAQPVTVSLVGTDPTASVVASLRASGMTQGDAPAGVTTQAAGDVVWSDAWTPEWGEETTLGATAWYAATVTPAVAAADAAWQALPFVVDHFTGGTNAELVEITLESDSEGEEVVAQVMRHYIVVQPSGRPGPYMRATLYVDWADWPDPFELATEPEWCDADGTPDAEGAYLRLPYPLALEDDPWPDRFAGYQSGTTIASGYTIVLGYLAEGEANEAAYSAWASLDAAASALTEAYPAGEPAYEAQLTLPAGLDLRDGATYALAATATANGLSSATATDSAQVAWAHQAQPPAESSAVVPDPATLSCLITPVAPEDALESDLCDVWRVTPDGAYLIASDVPFGTTVEDPYAPYSEVEGPSLAYRLVTMTADGDHEWRDFPYELRGTGIRIDWDGKALTLPYDVVLGDARSKGFELPERWDGSRPGRWDGGHTRTSSYTSDLVRLESWEERRLVAELGTFAAPCLVRTPTGQCYEADVQVTNFGDSYDSAVAVVALDIKECDITAEYMARLPDDTDYEAEEEGE